MSQRRFTIKDKAKFNIRPYPGRRDIDRSPVVRQSPPRPAVKRPLFNDGTATQFLAVKDKIVTEFVKKDCGMFIEPILPVVTDAVALANGWEADNEFEMPNHVLTDPEIQARCDTERAAKEADLIARLATYDTLYVNKVPADFNGNAASREAQANQYNNMMFSLKTPKVLEVRVEQAHLDEYIRTYRAGLLSQREKDISSHEARVLKHNKKCAECLAVFYETIDSHLLENVKEYLQAKKFKTAWRRIIAQYSLTRVGPQAYSTATAQFRKLRFASNYDMARHIVEFRRTMETYRVLGMPHDANAQFSMFRETFSKGGCTDYETIFDYYENIGTTQAWDMEVIFTRVSDKYQELASKRYERKIAPNHHIATAVAEHRVAAVSKSNGKKEKCSACGKPGHNAKDCWASMTCEKCGKKGHPANKCYQQEGNLKRANAVRVDEKDDHQESLVSTFKKNRTK